MILPFSRIPVTSRVPTEQTLDDKWCSVSYCNDPQVIRVTDRCCSYVLDKRVCIISVTLINNRVQKTYV